MPTSESMDEGAKIKKTIEKNWRPPPYYYHLRSGGHVEAVRSHLSHKWFLRVDIENFFGSINKTRVKRCLKSKFGYACAREWANASTVNEPSEKKRSFVPFGFVQSQIIAAICLRESALGRYLDKLKKNKTVSLSIYVDDIIVSSNDAKLCGSILEQLKVAAKRANFKLSADKKEGPATAITAFNIVIANLSMSIHEARLKRFVDALEHATSDHQREGILNYVMSVNAAQATELMK